MTRTTTRAARSPRPHRPLRVAALLGALVLTTTACQGAPDPETPDAQPTTPAAPKSGAGIVQEEGVASRQNDPRDADLRATGTECTYDQDSRSVVAPTQVEGTTSAPVAVTVWLTLTTPAGEKMLTAPATSLAAKPGDTDITLTPTAALEEAEWTNGVDCDIELTWSTTPQP